MAEVSPILVEVLPVVPPVVDPVVVKPSVQDELAALLKDAVVTKPKSVADALHVLNELEMKIGVWLVSDLSPADQKLVLATTWAGNQVEEVASGWCFPKKK